MTELSILKDNLRYLQQQGYSALPANVESTAHLLQLAENVPHTLEDLLYVNLAIKEQKAAGIQFLVMDCDGVLTDGAMVFTKNGDEIKHFNAKDGLGIKLLRQQNILTGIISAGRSSGLVESRAAMMKVDKVYVGKTPKWDILQEWLRELQLSPKAVAYIGDDLTDIPVMEKVGLSFCPADAAHAVKQTAHITLRTPGGKGCVRELIERYLED